MATHSSVVANGIISPFLTAKYYSIGYIYCIFFIHSSVDGHLGCFYILAILNHAAVNTGIYVSYKILIKEMKGDTNRWRDTPCSYIGKLSLVKMTVLSKAIQIQCNPYQTNGT